MNVSIYGGEKYTLYKNKKLINPPNNSSRICTLFLKNCINKNPFLLNLIRKNRVNQFLLNIGSKLLPIKELYFLVSAEVKKKYIFTKKVNYNY
jgi:hypothetical protein